MVSTVAEAQAAEAATEVSLVPDAPTVLILIRQSYRKASALMVAITTPKRHKPIVSWLHPD